MGILHSRNKTVLLPTHALNFLQYATQIVTLKDETISENGSYAELIASQGPFADLMREYASVDTAEQDTANGAEGKQAAGKDDAKEEEKPETPKSAGKSKSSGQLMKVEERVRGTVSGDVYWYYASQCGKGLVLFVLMCFIVGQVLEVFNTFLMAKWATGDTDIIIGYDETWSSNAILAYYLLVYGGSGLLVVSFTAAKIFITQLVGLSAARKLHFNMLTRLVKSPVKFFDVTPVGRIVNRFASDFDNIDRALAENCIGVFSSTFALVSCFGVIIWVLPLFALWLVPLLTCYYKVQKSYRLCAREMKRLNSTARSPIFQHFNETLQGLITIRAFNATERFSDKNVSPFLRQPAPCSEALTDAAPPDDQRGLPHARRDGPERRVALAHDPDAIPRLLQPLHHLVRHLPLPKNDGRRADGHGDQLRAAGDRHDGGIHPKLHRVGVEDERHGARQAL